MLGVFDSGFGGLTILRPIHARLPSLSTIYLGDNARAPYGTRTHEEIFAFAFEGVQELFRRGCPLVIFACNTASAQALRQIQQTELPHEFPDRRVLGVIRPTAEEIVSLSRTGHVGVMATPATVGSNAYLHELNHIRPNLVVTQVACLGLVELIEAGRERSEEADRLVATYCLQLIEREPLVDTVLLGCTHYPLVEPLFRKHLPTAISLVTQGTIVTDKLAEYLVRHPELASRLDQTGTRTYLTTKNNEPLSMRASRFFGSAVTVGHVVIS